MKTGQKGSSFADQIQNTYRYITYITSLPLSLLEVFGELFYIIIFNYNLELVLSRMRWVYVCMSVRFCVCVCVCVCVCK